MAIIVFAIVALVGLFLIFRALFPLLIVAIFIAIIVKIVKRSAAKSKSDFFSAWPNDRYFHEMAEIEKHKAKEAKYEAKAARSASRAIHEESNLWLAKSNYINAKAAYKNTRPLSQFIQLYKERQQNKVKNSKPEYIFCSYCGTKGSRIEANCRNCGAPLR